MIPESVIHHTASTFFIINYTIDDICGIVHLECYSKILVRFGNDLYPSIARQIEGSINSVTIDLELIRSVIVIMIITILGSNGTINPVYSLKVIGIVQIAGITILRLIKLLSLHLIFQTPYNTIDTSPRMQTPTLANPTGMLFRLVARRMIRKVYGKGIVLCPQFRQRNCDIGKAVEVIDWYTSVFPKLSGIWREYLRQNIIILRISYYTRDT